MTEYNNHIDSAYGDDQDKINEHVLYLHRCAKLSLPVYANSLSEEQRKISRAFLLEHLKREHINKTRQ